MKTIGKCAYCDDPLYDFEEFAGKGKVKYHIGCYKIRLTKSELEEDQQTLERLSLIFSLKDK